MKKLIVVIIMCLVFCIAAIASATTYFDNEFQPSGFSSELLTEWDFEGYIPSAKYFPARLAVAGFDDSGKYFYWFTETDIDLWSLDQFTLELTGTPPDIIHAVFTPGDMDGWRITSSQVVFNSEPVPEPGAILLLASGFIGLAAWRKR